MTSVTAGSALLTSMLPVPPELTSRSSVTCLTASTTSAATIGQLVGRQPLDQPDRGRRVRQPGDLRLVEHHADQLEGFVLDDPAGQLDHLLRRPQRRPAYAEVLAEDPQRRVDVQADPDPLAVPPVTDLMKARCSKSSIINVIRDASAASPASSLQRRPVHGRIAHQDVVDPVARQPDRLGQRVAHHAVEPGPLDRGLDQRPARAPTSTPPGSAYRRRAGPGRPRCGGTRPGRPPRTAVPAQPSVARTCRSHPCPEFRANEY